jgi:hypothetical protein
MPDADADADTDAGALRRVPGTTSTRRAHEHSLV